MSDQEAMHPTEEELHTYLDGDMDRSEHARIETHLAQCPPCQARLGAVRALFSTIESLPEEPLGRDLAGDVLDAISPQVGWPARMRALVAAELLIALTLLAVAWPRVASVDTLSEFTQTLSSAKLAWHIISREAVGSMIGLWDRAIHSAKVLASEWTPLAIPTTTVPLLWGAIVGALALGLAGNGALLRRDLYPRSKE